MINNYRFLQSTLLKDPRHKIKYCDYIIANWFKKNLQQKPVQAAFDTITDMSFEVTT